MIDINTALQTAYVNNLTGLQYNSVDVNVYYQNIPDSITDDVYIVLGPVTSVDDSDKSVNRTQTTMQVSITSFKEKYNDGLAVNYVAGRILRAIVPNPQSKLTLTDGYNSLVVLVYDSGSEFRIQNQRNYIRRVITFRNQIQH